MKYEMRIHINDFDSFQEAEEARAEFPFCASCKSRTKIQAGYGRFFVKCMKNSQHFGMGNGVFD